MPDHAGFAAAMTVRERVLSEVLLFAYARQSFKHNLLIPVQGPGPAVLIEAFLTPPTVVCDGSTGTLVLSAEFRGLLQYTQQAGATAEAKGVVAQLKIALPPDLTLGKDHQLTLGLAGATVTQWTFSVVFGDPFSATADAYLRSGPFSDRLTVTIRWALGLGLLPIPQIDVGFVGEDIAKAAAPAPDAPDGTTAVVPARVVDGALVAGLDVPGFLPPWQPAGHDGPLSITGDPGELADFARTYDVAVVTNPAALPILLARVEQEIVDAVGSGGTVESLELTAVDGKFGVAGKASNGSGTATFTFTLVPHTTATRPGLAVNYIEKPFVVKARSYAGLWFSTADLAVDVHADLSFWDTVLLTAGTIISFGVVLVSVLEMEDAAAYGYGMSIAAGSSGAPVPLVRHVSTPALSDVTLRIAIDEYSITPDGAYLGVHITPKPQPAAFFGPESIPASLGTEPLSYAVRLPLGVEADDPQVHVQWTVIDPATGTVHVNDDGLAQIPHGLGPPTDRTTFTLVPEQAAAGLTTYAVGCRVYRVAGPQSTDLLNDTIDLAVRPTPTGPAYVAWDYAVPRHWVTFDAGTNAWTYVGEPLAMRTSTIHRVDGCRFWNKGSRYQTRVTNWTALPFPAAEIGAHRSQLCDYCFYGGPTGMRATL